MAHNLLYVYGSCILGGIYIIVKARVARDLWQRKQTLSSGCALGLGSINPWPRALTITYLSAWRHCDPTMMHVKIWHVRTLITEIHRISCSADIPPQSRKGLKYPKNTDLSIDLATLHPYITTQTNSSFVCIKQRRVKGFLFQLVTKHKWFSPQRSRRYDGRLGVAII